MADSINLKRTPGLYFICMRVTLFYTWLMHLGIRWVVSMLMSIYTRRFERQLEVNQSYLELSIYCLRAYYDEWDTRSKVLPIVRLGN
jgi:hypothetical protein